jgi:uncharacterized protein
VIVVSNSTPLIALSKISYLSLVQDLFGSITIPQAVYQEVVTQAPTRPGAIEIRQASWIKTQVAQDQTKINYLLADLERGEAETLVLAEELSANWVLLDEAKARLVAEFLDLNYIGTVGLLLVAKRMGYIPAIRPLLDELIANRFFLSQKIYQSLLTEAGE